MNNMFVYNTLGSIFGIQPPLSRSYACQIVCHYPDNLEYLPFDEAAIKTVSHYIAR